GAFDRGVGDDGAAGAVGLDVELRGDVLAEQGEVGGVAAVGDAERAAQVIGGLGEGRRGRAVGGDVGEGERLVETDAVNEAAEVDRVVEPQRAGAGEGHLVGAAAGGELDRAGAEDVAVGGAAGEHELVAALDHGAADDAAGEHVLEAAVEYGIADAAAGF